MSPRLRGALLAGLLTAAPMQQTDQEVVWRSYLKKHLSDQFVSEHFRLHQIHTFAAGQGTLTYIIKYGDIVVHTRTVTPGPEGIVSGLARIEGGEIVSYFGPLKEYQLKISKEQAAAIMLKQGCELGSRTPRKGIAVPPRARSRADQPAPEAGGALRLFIGDYWEKTGKYSPDHTPEGFYWVGGTPPAKQRGAECMADAETGEFRIKGVGPH